MEYAFNATALGLGGVIERGGVTTVFPSLGSVVLPSSGGEGSAEVRNYHSDDISFGTLQTRVGGYRITEDLFSTYSDILVSGLSIFGRLRVHLMQLTLTSTRRISDGPQSEARFDVRASYKGVAIDDEEVVPELDLEMCAFETYGQFLQIAQGESQRIADKLDQPLSELTTMLQQPAPTVRGAIIADLHKPPTSQLYHRKNKIDITGLGTVHFGELLLKSSRRRINLLRLDYGDRMQEANTGDGGTVVFASGEGNGTPVWPNS